MFLIRVISSCMLVVITQNLLGQNDESSSSDDRTIEEVVVLGTLTRLESKAEELPVPVDVHNDFELDSTGEFDLGAALTKLAPSFNYSRHAVGDGALLTAATLRGMAPDQTLVLVNGKRRHSMAWLRVLDGVVGYGTGGTDLRSIPTAAVARVEVMRDGAAAQYGSDAIAGVINLALKQDTDSELNLHAGQAPGADAGRVGMSFNGGMKLGFDGYINLTGEWYDNDPLHQYGGNGGFDPNYQDELVTYSSPDHTGQLFFINAALPVGEAGELYSFGGASLREGTSSGAARFRYKYWDGIKTGSDTLDFVLPNFINFHERNAHPVYPNGFVPYEESEISDTSLTLGWRTAMGHWNLDLSLGFGKNTFDFGVSNSINASIAAQYVLLNPDASVSDVIAHSGPTEGSSGGIEFAQTTFNVDIRRTFTDSFVSAFASGLERRQESYQQNAGIEASWSCGLPHARDYGAFAIGPDGKPLDGIVAACGFQGYPGYSPRNAQLSDDSRDSSAAFLEIESQPFTNFTLGIALRVEDYSDAGDSMTGKLAARMQLSETLAIRSAISTGFRAPSLSQRRFNSILFVASDTGLSTTFAANEGHPIARLFGVEALKHETATNWSAGIVGQSSNGQFRYSMDFYNIDIDDRVVRSAGLACVGLAACDNEHTSTAAFFFNGVDTKTQGIDISTSWGMPFVDGYLWLSANGHRNKTEITDRHLPAKAPADLSFDDYYGGWAADLLERGQPRLQANVSASWQRDTWGALLRMNHFGETTQHPLATDPVAVAADQTMDLEAWLEQGAIRLVLGVNNAFNTLPTELSKLHTMNVLWGIRYPTDTPFGLEGRYAYLNLKYRFNM